MWYLKGMDKKLIMTGIAMGFAGFFRVLITDWLDKRKAAKAQLNDDATAYRELLAANADADGHWGSEHPAKPAAPVKRLTGFSHRVGAIDHKPLIRACSTTQRALQAGWAQTPGHR